MSKTFTSRTALSQRGRGRGRTSSNDAEPSLRGEGVRPAPASSNRGAFADAAPTGMRAARGRVNGGPSGGTGRGLGRGVKGPGKDGSPSRKSLQERAVYAGGFTVIKPDEKRRREVAEQAERESRQYEQFKKHNKPSNFSYVGTAGEGESVSLTEARQQQAHNQIQHNKTNRLMREQDRRDRQRQAENKTLAEKKEAARRQSTMTTQKQKEPTNWKSDMHRVNQAFLDRLEAQSKSQGASAHSSQQT